MFAQQVVGPGPGPVPWALGPLGPWAHLGPGATWALGQAPGPLLDFVFIVFFEQIKQWVKRIGNIDNMLEHN